MCIQTIWLEKKWTELKNINHTFICNLQLAFPQPTFSREFLKNELNINQIQENHNKITDWTHEKKYKVSEAQWPLASHKGIRWEFHKGIFSSLNET